MFPQIADWLIAWFDEQQIAWLNPTQLVLARVITQQWQDDAAVQLKRFQTTQKTKRKRVQGH